MTQAPDTTLMAAYAEKALLVTQLAQVEQRAETAPDLSDAELAVCIQVGLFYAGMKSGEPVPPGSLEALMSWLWAQLARVRHLRPQPLREGHQQILDQVEEILLRQQLEVLKHRPAESGLRANQ